MKVPAAGLSHTHFLWPKFYLALSLGSCFYNAKEQFWWEGLGAMQKVSSSCTREVGVCSDCSSQNASVANAKAFEREKKAVLNTIFFLLPSVLFLL